MPTNRLLTTRLLDEEGKIGPFFFQEFLLIFLSAMSLFILVLLYALFFPIHGMLLVIIPGTFLLLVGLIRCCCFKGRITSPWYRHKWVARHWIRPQHFVPQAWKPPSPAIWPKKP